MTWFRNERWDPDFSTTAIHALDGALYLAASPFRSVSIRYTRHRQGGKEAYDVSLDAECESGTGVAITILPVSGRNLEAARVLGIGRCLCLRLPFSPEGPSEGRLEHWRRGELVETFTDGHLDFSERIGVYGETRAFLDAARLGHAAIPRLDDCLQQVGLMEALRRAPGGRNRPSIRQSVAIHTRSQDAGPPLPRTGAGCRRQFMKLPQIAATPFTVRDFCTNAADLARTAAKLRAIGYQAVQLSRLDSVPPEEVVALMDENRLTICSTHEPSDDILAQPEKCIEKLRRLGCTLTAYRFRRESILRRLGVPELVKRLDASGAVFRRAGMTLGYHIVTSNLGR